MYKVVCNQCGQHFEKRLVELKRIKTNKCKHSGKELITKYCLECGKEINASPSDTYSSYNIKKFCSGSCSATYNNKHTVKENENKKYCLNCGKEIPLKNKFCSSECYQEHKRKESKPHDYSREAKKFWRQQIKHRGVQALGNICASCGNQYPDCCYDFHHLDKNEKDFTVASVQTNGAKSWLKIRDELKKCTLLCANCHRLLHSGLLEIENKNYFDEEYYEWDLTKFNFIDKETLKPKDACYVCPTCGGYKSRKSKQCQNCIEKLTIDREELKQLIFTKPFIKIGEMYGVTSTTIRTKCKQAGLPYRKQDIIKYSAEEWKNI